MKNKKILIGVISISLVLIISVILLISNNNTNNIVSSKKPIVDNSFLTLMIEQSDGSYQESTSNTWPEGNFVFNSTLSRCENGGELAFDRTTNKVVLYNNKSDACYIYFDIYNSVQITNVTTSTTYNSVTLTVASQAGENEIETYYFTRNDGASWEQSSSNTYTYSGLSSNTEYNFRVYAVDTEGYPSNEYTLSATTNAYVNPRVNSVTASNVTNNSITVSVNASGGTNSISRYYYSSNGGSSYANTTSNTYTFSGLSAGQNYSIRVYVKDTNGVDSNVYTINAETESVVYLCSTGTNFATCIKNQYTSQGANGLYYHTSSLANSAEDNSYRYAGANPNNYVCFGDDCSNEDNLYRIIGVFGSEVKLIKNTSYGDYVWNSSTSSNTWSTSNIKKTLNSTYYNTLNPTWQNKIATHTYKVGGMSYSTTNTAKQYYNTEVGSSSSSTPDSMKIGLMYVSDFGFAASPDYWTRELYNYDPAKSSNWLAGLNEWTISRRSGTTSYAFRVSSSGVVGGNSRVNYAVAVRPVFYLNSSINYVSGSGSSADPIRIT